jgi:multidrug efflux system membrane fusion protein
VLTTLVSVSPIYASFDADEQVVTKALKDLPGGNGARQPHRSASRADGHRRQHRHAV